MSYRDLRNFSETMRVLGFPKAISLESFRTPNWGLMEECLRWLASRVEPDSALPRAATVDQRVALVSQAIALFHSRANLKLNGKRLYGADGWAVRELLKAGMFLRAALEAPPRAELRDDAAVSYDVSGRLGEIKQARSLATEITAQGAFLYDLLVKEADNKEVRSQALSRPLELSALEAGLARAVQAARARGEDVRARILSVAASEAALDAKLERRRAELLRAEKRLHTVQKIKPAYQGELCALEAELERLWEQYVLRYRCVEALKHQLSVLETTQAEEAEEQEAAIMQLIHKYETEDVLGKLSDSENTESSDEEKDLSEKQPRPATRPKTRLRIKTAGQGVESRRAFGSMAGVGVGAGGARGDSLDIRDEDDSRSDSDGSDADMLEARGAGSARWGRARPSTRTLRAPHDDFDDLIEGVEGGDGGDGDGDSLGSSSESELRLTSARPSAAPGRTSVLSDNEF